MTRDFKRDWEGEAIRCIKCGSCQVFCPVFQETRNESFVARGKVMLMRSHIKGDIELTEGFAQRMDTCLLCKRCVANCPAGVRTDRLVEAARTELADKKGLPFIKKVIFRVGLKNAGIFDTGMKLGAIGQGLLFRRTEHGMLPRLPMGLDRKRMIKNLAPRSLRASLPVTTPAKGEKQMRVAFFTGCAMNYMYTDAGRAVVDVLSRGGAEVVLPRGQHCCGTPVRAHGDRDTAIEMAKANIDALERANADVIVTACASCGLALKEEWAELLHSDATYAPRAKALAAKVKDFSEVALAMPRVTEALGPVAAKVTWHDPCHLVRGQKITQQPRKLMKAVPSLEFKEMAQADNCCGSGGTFSLSHYDLTMKINSRKVKNILDSQAEVVVTECPGCMMQIQDGLQQAGAPVHTMHLAELLSRSLAAKEGR
ncbi:MAG TPA: (Fe-S)-binding protein [Symbiobacteriaceae bacterium]|nr:(Fe-S)-binding protein [Symbiobacteriaceae bacterium]